MSKRVVAAAAAGLALSVLAGPAFAACAMNKIAELPVTMRGLRPLVPAKINGQELMFIADSGAFYSTINRPVAERLKLSLNYMNAGFTVGGLGGDAQAQYTVVKTFTLVGANLPNITFLVAGSGDGDGLLGQNVLGIADVEYDLSHGAIRLVKPAGCGQTPLAYWAAKTGGASVMNIRAPEQDNPHTIGEVTVNGVKLKAGFDTGAPVSMITLEAAARLGIKPDSPGVESAGTSSGLGPRPLRNWIAPVASFKIGDEEIKNTRLRIVDTDADFGADMLIGADFFLSHRVYVSNSQHKLYFTYNGGPVFNLTARSMVQVGANGTPQESKPQAPTSAGPEPTTADGFSRRGAALASRRDLDGAIADFSKAIEMAPTEAKYYYQRATAKMGNRQGDQAMADLDQAIKLAPADTEALWARAALHMGAKNATAAVSDLDAIDRLAPQAAEVRLGMAAFYESLDRLDASIHQYSLWIDSHAGDGRLYQALNGRCWTRALAGKELDKALADCNRAIRALPKAASLLDSRGLVELRMGQYDKAIADYDAALALNGKLAWSLYGRGVAKLNKGMKAQGEADLAAAKAASASFPEQGRKYGVVAPAGG